MAETAADLVFRPAARRLVTDGFGCRHQIAHGSERRALHLAEVIQMALRHGPWRPPLRTPGAEAPR